MFIFNDLVQFNVSMSLEYESGANHFAICKSSLVKVDGVWYMAWLNQSDVGTIFGSSGQRKWMKATKVFKIWKQEWPIRYGL
jgi:hypothetical protein